MPDGLNDRSVVVHQSGGVDIKMVGDAQDGFREERGFADEGIIGGATNPGLMQDLRKGKMPFGAYSAKFMGSQIHTGIVL